LTEADKYFQQGQKSSTQPNPIGPCSKTKELGETATAQLQILANNSFNKIFKYFAKDLKEDLNILQILPNLKKDLNRRFKSFAKDLKKIKTF